MKRRYGFGLLLLAYFLSGLFVVPGDQKGIVRRFGRIVRPLRSSGLNFDLPWPFARVDWVNFNEVRTLTLGEMESDSNFLLATSAARPSSFLTGDRNLLLLRISVQYRISEEIVAEWLFASESVNQRLEVIVESTVTALAARCGVDFIHTQGLAELNNLLLQEVRRHVALQRLGCEIEQVSIDRAEPPARAKAEFLDVSNARADMARAVHEARGYAEQKLAESQADARKLIDEAVQSRQSKTASAKGSADRFESLVGQIRRDSEIAGRSYESSKQLVMDRLTTEAIRKVLENVKQKIVIDGHTPFDLTFPTSKSPP